MNSNWNIIASLLAVIWFRLIFRSTQLFPSPLEKKDISSLSPLKAAILSKQQMAPTSIFRNTKRNEGHENMRMTMSKKSANEYDHMKKLKFIFRGN